MENQSPDQPPGAPVNDSSAEAGGSVTFSIPPGHSPLDLMALCQEALDWCNQFPDPNNPPATQRRIKRLRVSFAKAVIS